MAQHGKADESCTEKVAEGVGWGCQHYPNSGPNNGRSLSQIWTGSGPLSLLGLTLLTLSMADEKQLTNVASVLRSKSPCLWSGHVSLVGKTCPSGKNPEN